MKVTLAVGIPQETEVSKAQVVVEIEGCMFLITLFALPRAPILTGRIVRHFGSDCSERGVFLGALSPFWQQSVCSYRAIFSASTATDLYFSLLSFRAE